MKKILIFIPNLQGGGAEKVAINLSNILAKDKCIVYLMYLKKNGFNIKNLNKNINFIYLNKERLLFAIFSIIDFLLKNKKNLNIISFLNAPNFVFCFIKFLFGLKNINLTITIHNSMSDSYKNSNLKGKIIIFLLKHFNSFADKIICVSKYVKKDLITNWKLNNKNIFTIYNPAINKKEIKSLSKKKNLFLKKFKSNNLKIILSVGRLTKQKNYELLINAFYEIKKVTHNTILVILGTGELKESLNELVQKKGLKKNVIFMGFQKNPYNFIKHSDLIVLSSDWEGLPTILIEALYLKKKIVSTNCNGGCSEVLANGKYGYLVPMNDVNRLKDKILFALNNKSKKIDRKYLYNFMDKFALKKYKSVIFRN
ncbi:glycosyltransferase [Candidatus Pelagibacter sp.]|nr:glycosyltransferase [Candidatus Pelagibacter sp.]